MAPDLTCQASDKAMCKSSVKPIFDLPLHCRSRIRTFLGNEYIDLSSSFVSVCRARHGAADIVGNTELFESDFIAAKRLLTLILRKHSIWYLPASGWVSFIRLLAQGERRYYTLLTCVRRTARAQGELLARKGAAEANSEAPCEDGSEVWPGFWEAYRTWLQKNTGRTRLPKIAGFRLALQNLLPVLTARPSLNNKCRS